jgi:hypothetical protein
VPDHVLVEVVALPGQTACCSCGWRSIPTISLEQAEMRWRIHVGERRAHAWSTEAARLTSVFERRSAELADVRATVQARRLALRSQRVRVRASSLERAIGRLAGVSRVVGPRLDRAREMAGMTRSELWTGYLGLGGHLNSDQLDDRLSGRTAIARLDYDILAVVLNERFAENGLGHPIDFWDSLELPADKHGT